MAKKRAAKKKAARRTPTRKKAKKKLLRRSARAIGSGSAVEIDVGDLSTVEDGAVRNADALAAAPVAATAIENVAHAANEVTDALPGVEVLAREQQGPIGELVVYRELLWLVGPARRPRSAIVGRALGQAGGVSEATARTFEQVCTVISRNGPHHLREEFVVPLRDYISDPARHSRTLSNLLGPAVAYLCQLNLVGLGAQRGMYLVGLGTELFEGWPEWQQQDQEPTMPRRRRQREQGGPAAGPAPPSPPALPLLGRRLIRMDETEPSTNGGDAPRPTHRRLLPLNDDDTRTSPGS